MPQIVRRWLSLRVSLQPGTISIEYRDAGRTDSSVGRAPARHPSATAEYMDIPDQFSAVSIPADLDQVLEAALAARPIRLGATGLATVPFLSSSNFPTARSS